MFTALTEAITALEKMLEAYKTSLEEQTTTEVVKEKKSLKKASDITEEILDIVENYKHLFNEKDLKLYNKLRSKFLRVNS